MKVEITTRPTDPEILEAAARMWAAIILETWRAQRGNGTASGTDRPDRDVEKQAVIEGSQTQEVLAR